MGPFVNVDKVFSFEFLYLLTDLDNVFFLNLHDKMYPNVYLDRICSEIIGKYQNTQGNKTACSIIATGQSESSVLPWLGLSESVLP